ncbi:hypothetical protein BDR26DRAFT_896140 [Obelidium mucronatum]|nr:hypothetical protein BDR26DRAFT_896140 [Obelidium mucronatum]
MAGRADFSQLIRHRFACQSQSTMTTPVDDLPQLLSDFITHFGNLETQLQHLEAQVSVFRPIAQKLQLRFQDVTSPAEIISEMKIAASRNSQIDNSISKTAVEEWENRPDTTNLADSPEINPEITAIICSTSNQPTNNLIYEAVKYSRHGSKSSLSQIGSLANLATGTRRTKLWWTAFKSLTQALY